MEKVPYATSALGDSRVIALSECPRKAPKTTDDRLKEYKDKLRAVFHRSKYAVKDGKIYIITRKGHLGQGVFC
ncbi:MAG: hypothetical protein II063_10470 [Prevotella sp.]|nr:hypothetical protein [Prevotella sp.]